MDLKRGEYKIFDEKYLDLVENLKEEEIKAQNVKDVMEILKKEVELRIKAFEFIYRIGKRAETCAEKEIISLHDKENSKVKYVKRSMECPECTMGEGIRELCRNLNTPGFIHIEYSNGESDTYFDFK